MRFDEFVKNASFALSEGSVYERLRRIHRLSLTRIFSMPR